MVADTKTAERRSSPGNRKASSSPVPDDSHIARLCVESGLKMTGQRRVIAYVLSIADDHPDVEELYRRASEIDSRISVATVYRTVRLLEEKGILERRDFGGGRARYEASDSGNHYHLIDVDSGRVIEFEDDEPVRLLEQLAQRLGFDLVSHRIELFGRRAEPENKKKSPPENRNKSGS
ncbi:Fur family transcriptional regulator [Gluconobacter kondonii]|uniref:Fur family transcriptional regulator n=1 Tax=Gluconobacter kondonii TaxID=941463 RepID=UPI00197E8D3F|nr:Fur family transcriptional regulator [Gluconobacter kondonii]MBN3866904.1 transcriptional repressor [Gluconobacter kondonii]MBS1052598.1 transcriptional repressor [Gluconobacter kondonii]MBS1055991.1 transcriptional repressor [Gluconobacter kondonii]MBS1077236.1 transcriptional repressor [Gluconobacter kondonii]MBS1080651.1 transcriptional repressor [Gluconobacter kondonii]